MSSLLVLSAVLNYSLPHMVCRFIKPFLLQLTLPNDYYRPILCFKLPPDVLVSLLIPSHFFNPEIRIRLRDSVLLAVLVSMPEATVYKDDRSVLGKDDIGRARKALDINSVAEAELPEGMTQLQFRAGILGSVVRHTFEALFWGHGETDYNANLHRFN